MLCPGGKQMNATVKIKDLQQAIALSEQIKQIIHYCFGINMMGLNAILLSKRAGESASGFGVVSDEIRALSNSLQKNMALLDSLALQLVNLSSQLLKVHRRQVLFRRTHEISDQPERYMQDTLARNDHSLNHLHTQLGTTYKRLRTHIDDSKEICMLGVVLARAAKIESAYTGNASISLRDVSDRFEYQVQQLMTGVETLQNLFRNTTSGSPAK